MNYLLPFVSNLHLNYAMIASLISLLPNILTALFFIVATWIIARLWYTGRYIHRNEVRPLQESQYMMQNQYAVLAERIKQTDAQLIETKAKLEQTIAEREEVILKLKEAELNTETRISGFWKDEIITELKNYLSNTGNSAEDKFSGKEQFNFIRQSLKEFQSELAQKSNISTIQFHELSNQLWQLIELNKKLSADTEQLNKLISSTAPGDENKLAERPFTLASIKKRS